MHATFGKKRYGAFNQKKLRSIKIESIVLYLGIITVLLLESSLLYLNIIPSQVYSFSNYGVKYFTCGIALVLAVIKVLSNAASARKGVKAIASPFAPVVYAILFLGLITSIVSVLHYGYSFITVFKISYAFTFIPLIYIGFHSLVENKRNYDFLVFSIIGIATLFALVCLLRSFGFKITNDLVIPAFGFRNDRIRILVSGDFVAMGAVLAMGRVFGKEKKGRIFAFLCLVICSFELYWVAQTRAILVAIIIVVGCAFIIQGKSRGVRIFSAALIALLFLSHFSNSIFAFLFPSELSFSTDARLGAYSYYARHAVDMGLLGIGYVPYSFGSIMSMIVATGSSARGDITDIGIVGYYGRYGILGIALLIFIIYTIIKKIIICRDKPNFRFDINMEAWLLLFYVIAISPTMAISDTQRILFIPILLLLLDRALNVNAYSFDMESDM